MSLLGRLEDLSLTDIIQIVFLSRRTGVLEIIDDQGRHTVLFRDGLIVNASSPEHPDLVAWWVAKGAIRASDAKKLRDLEEKGIDPGSAAVDLNLISTVDIANSIRTRVVDVVTPLLHSREGEFNFILSEAMDRLDIEYDADAIFKEGGLLPQKIIGTAEGEKIKPLKGLEESLKAGKALLRSSAPTEPGPVALELGLGQSNVVPFPDVVDVPAAAPNAGAPQKPPAPLDFSALPEDEPEETSFSDRDDTLRGGRFRVAGGLFEVESPEMAFRNVVIFERNPLVRVAAKRAFGKRNVRIFQYGVLDDVRAAITDLVHSNSFFVTFLENTQDDAATRLMQQLKRRNPRLPVVIVDNETDLRRRHDLLRMGADLYLTKPGAQRLQPGLAEEELALYADELLLFAERSFDQWEQLSGSLGSEAGRRFYESAEKESVERSFSLVKQLINELSNPNDIGQVSAIILRSSAEYLERGALFMVTEREFIGLGGFGATAAGDALDVRVKRIRLPRNLPSVLASVADSGEVHRGKMRKTAVNVDLIEQLGGVLPTEVVALPIMHTARAIGILYGDNAEHHAPIDGIAGLEIFLSQAGYAFGNAVIASQNAGK
ncbi:MAG: response regulator [Thermoanaerobaculia bacterium]